METDLDILEEVVNIVHFASLISLDVYNGKDMEVELKQDDSPVTIADKKCAEFINKELNKLDPNIPIINEETTKLPYEERKNHEYMWVVDPIDGTKEFIKKTGEFTVNIGLIKNGKVVLGVVGIPTKEITYYGSIELGAFKKNWKGAAEPIMANKWNPHKDGIKIATSKSHMNKSTEDYIALWVFKNQELMAAGSSLKILYVADGTIDFYPRIGPTMEWDTCAAHGVLKSAGGNLTNLENEELVYNKEDLYNPHFIVYGK